MKLNRKYLRKMILNEIKKLNESNMRDQVMRRNMGDTSYQQHLDSQDLSFSGKLAWMLWGGM